MVVPKRVGHEYSGTIADVGAEVDRVKVGDRVAVFSIAYCGECAGCRTGTHAFACTNHGDKASDPLDAKSCV